MYNVIKLKIFYRVECTCSELLDNLRKTDEDEFCDKRCRGNEQQVCGKSGKVGTFSIYERKGSIKKINPNSPKITVKIYSKTNFR